MHGAIKFRLSFICLRIAFVVVRKIIANYHYGDVAKIDSLISLGISVGLGVDFPNDFRGFTMCPAGQ